jgi:hypothetical protein
MDAIPPQYECRKQSAADLLRKYEEAAFKRNDDSDPERFMGGKLLPDELEAYKICREGWEGPIPTVDAMRILVAEIVSKRRRGMTILHGMIRYREDAFPVVDPAEQYIVTPTGEDENTFTITIELRGRRNEVGTFFLEGRKAWNTYCTELDYGITPVAEADKAAEKVWASVARDRLAASSAPK